MGSVWWGQGSSSKSVVKKEGLGTKNEALVLDHGEKKREREQDMDPLFYIHRPDLQLS